MTTVLVVRGEARRELVEASEYYDEQRPGYGERFTDAVEREFALLLEFPNLGATVGRRVHRRVLSDWPYSIFYINRGDELLVLALGHHSRRPGYWRSRLH
jgi:plasmid stabilization system protein ParE